MIESKSTVHVEATNEHAHLSDRPLHRSYHVCLSIINKL